MRERSIFSSTSRLLRLAVFIVAVFAIGIVGYMVIEQYSPMEALYMTAITLTTTGFEEVQPLSNGGRLFTIALLFLGAGVLAFALGSSVDFVMGSFSGQLARRRMLNKIEKMDHHIIVCGYGRVGRSAALALAQSDFDIVVIERDKAAVDRAETEGMLAMEGDATEDDTLLDAGVDRADGMLVSTGDDAVNLFVVLSARAINPSLYIVARSANLGNEQKMRQAGADRVVSPHRIGGQHMANIIIRPHVTDFFDVVTLDNGQELWLEELVLAEGARLCNQTIGEADVRSLTGVTIVAIVRKAAGSTITPKADTFLEAGDQLIVLGMRDQLTEFESWVRSDNDPQHVARRARPRPLRSQR